MVFVDPRQTHNRFLLFVLFTADISFTRNALYSTRARDMNVLCISRTSIVPNRNFKANQYCLNYQFWRAFAVIEKTKTGVHWQNETWWSKYRMWQIASVKFNSHDYSFHSISFWQNPRHEILFEIKFKSTFEIRPFGPSCCKRMFRGFPLKSVFLYYGVNIIHLS